MSTLDLDHLLRAVSPGGPSCLSSTTELQPAGGPHSSAAPAKYTGKDTRGNDTASYAYEQRFLDGACGTPCWWTPSSPNSTAPSRPCRTRSTPAPSPGAASRTSG